MCKECIYDPKGGSGGWKQQVEECTSKNCPLWPERPTSTQIIAKLEIIESKSENLPKQAENKPLKNKVSYP